MNINHRIVMLLSDAMYHLDMASKYGGDLFEYFRDCGIEEFDLYVQDDMIGFVTYFCNMAKSFPDKIYGNIDNVVQYCVTMNCKEKVDVFPLAMAERQEKKKTIVYCGEWNWAVFKTIQNLNYRIVTLGELIKYSLYKNVVFKELKSNLESKGAKVIFSNFPKANMVQNKSELENYFSNNGIYGYDDKKEDYYRSLNLDTSRIFVDTLGDLSCVGGVYRFADVQSDHFNVVNGFRVTADVPNYTKNKIWMFGSSVARGAYVDDEHTIESALQRKINEYFKENDKYGVVNASNFSANEIWYMAEFAKKLPIVSGDICIVHLEYPKLVTEQIDGIINLQPYFERPHAFGEIFCDINHMNENGYKAQADVLFKILLEREFFNSDNVDSVVINESKIEAASNLSFAENKELQQYIDGIKKYKPTVGSIVMNCNPFTLGHRYLIESSAKKVDRLIIFVVQEDDKFFRFDDRIELVRRGTADIPNVVVIPSGNFIISQRTFAAYSNKSKIQDQVIDPSMDVEIFAQQIAPALGINVRFAGEEPLDKITKQYNDTMSRILPQYGIRFEVISRKEMSGSVISASRVRKLLKEKDFEGIKELVPPTTYEFLVEKYS